jgi:hypothetical protein
VSTRSEHMAWAKERALAYVDAGDVSNAFASLTSDVSKHPETADHGGIDLGYLLLMSGSLSTVPEMREYIEGFR